MTALRPERDGSDVYGAPAAAAGAPYTYDNTEQFAAVVEQLDDPLTDPLPGRQPPRRDAAQPGARQSAPGNQQPRQQAPPPPPSPAVEPVPEQQWFRDDPAPAPAPAPTPVPETDPDTLITRLKPSAGVPPPGSMGVDGAPRPRRRRAAPSGEPPDPTPSDTLAAGSDPHQTTSPDHGQPDAAPAGGRAARRRAAQESVTSEPASGGGGRAARRKAAQERPRRRHSGSSPGARRAGQGKRSRAAAGRSASVAAGAAGGASGAARAGGTAAAAAAVTGAGGTGERPASRVAARRAARAAKDSPAVVASRVLGELFITFGVLLLLFVAYQLWWTNVLAHKAANGAAKNLEEKWKDSDGDERAPGAFEPGQGFAILYIPKLDVKAPIAEGIDKHKVLDRGMIGHYSGELETAMPWNKKGNFAVAGHRNTHGEPFRYINKLQPGDEIIIETQHKYYTYKMTSLLPQTPPSNVSVIKPVPVGSGFTKSGRYITLTTCTPEFTSKYRLIVWGKLSDERPRSKGKPDALVG